MKHHIFSPRAAAAAAAMAILLAGGTTTEAMAAVTSTSAPSAQQSTPTVPGAPTALTATGGNGIATLSWSAPSSDGGSPVDFYVIEGGRSPSGGGIAEKVGGAGQTATIGGLTNGTVYYFRVHAQNAYGDGAASVTVPVTPQGPVSVPGPPAGLRTSHGGGFIALSWSQPTSTGGSPITGYHVYRGSSPSLVGARVFAISGTSFRDTDVENGSRYYIKVTALNAVGEGQATAVTSVMPLAPDVPRPGPSRPTGLAPQGRRGAVILSWSPPKGGLKAGEGYLIYIGTSSGHEGAKPSIPYLIQGATSYRIAPLKNGTRYYFQVALLDRNNRVSARSAEVSAVPGSGASAPGPAAGPSADVGTSAGSDAGAAAQPSASPLPGSELAQDRTSPSLPAGLVVLLAALVLAAAAAGTTAIILLRRRRYDRRYGPVPAPWRPHDDQPTAQFRRTEEMNGPRYR